MFSLRALALFALPLFSTVLCNQEPASPTQQVYTDAQAFKDLLNALPEESLHAALHGKLPNFQDGVFESGHHGVEAIHSENPPLATKLIVAAVQELKKRQAQSTNGTSNAPASQTQGGPGSSSAAVASPPASSQAPPASSNAPQSQPAQSSQESAVVVPVPIATTTNAQGSRVVVSSAILSAPTASVAVPVTKTNAQGQTFVSRETRPAVIMTATDAAGNTFTTASAVDFAPTAGQVITTTDSKGSTFLTTYTPGGGKVSSIVLVTATGADGKPTVKTSYTFVNPAQATGADGKPLPSGSQTARPGLQSGAAGSLGRYWGMEAALVGGAIAMWI